MAEDFIEEIYKEAYLITVTKKIVSFCRLKKIEALQTEWDNIIVPVTDLCHRVVCINEELGNRIWGAYQKARDLIMLRNYEETAIELEKVLPLMQEAVKTWGIIDVTEDEYRLVSSASGFLNLHDISKNIVFHSMVDPVWEKYELAKSIYNPKMNKACLLGCGLGYLAWQLYIYSNESIDVYIYDTSERIVKYACQYGTLGNIPKEKLHIVIDNKIESLLQKYALFLDEFKQDAAVLYVEDFFEKQLQDGAKAIVQGIQRMIQTKIEFGELFEHNHYRNIQSVNKNINDIVLNKKSSEWIVVGGGPSVDDNLDYVKDNCERKIIIAATTVYAKLIDEGIQPDYIAAIDPQNRTFGHLKNVANSETPLIITDTANWQFGDRYTGDKYIVETSGYYFSNPITLKYEWYSQGTVTGFCIDVAAYLGATSIELVGVDLSYPTNHSHAKGTMDDEEIDIASMIRVKSVSGGEVFTDEILKGYISDIEAQIKKYREIKFFNLSKNGAYIDGCK